MQEENLGKLHSAHISMSITLFLLPVNFGLKLTVLKFSRIFGLIVFKSYRKIIDTILFLLGKKMCCVKDLWIVKAVKAKHYSPKISKTGCFVVLKKLTF